jgi:hypothetical protein
MDVEDFLEPEVAVTAAVTAVVFSPKGRKFLRRGAVYGLAGLLMAGDALASLARGVGEGAQRVGASAAQSARTTMDQAQQQASTTQASAESSPMSTTKKTMNKGGTGQKAATEGIDSQP